MASDPMSQSSGLDLADPAQRDIWLAHPVMGDASFDTFVRDAGNPLWTGSPPFEWPVNGFLFRDPPSGWLYAYIGLYPRGYWPPGGCRLLRSRDDGGTWDDCGSVLDGSAETFDGDGQRPGGMPDVSLVYHDGTYHMVYDWCTPTNDDGGIAYASSTRPDGQFVRAAEPIHAESRQPVIHGVYQRVYAATLLKRRTDWLILADLSTPRNAGSTWALVCFTAPHAAGPYDGPRLLLYPQSTVFHPAPIEFFPCFVHEDYVYAPATSVAANRTVQAVFRAPLEEAHEPAAWEALHYGSVWHAEPVPHEAQGIWGQTISGLVDAAGQFRVLYPSMTADDVGTINTARRPWNDPYHHGFVLSAPNAPALSVCQRVWTEFRLDAQVRSTGAKAIIWQHTAPLGSAHAPAFVGPGPLQAHPLSFSACLTLTLDGDGWRIERIDPNGGRQIVGAAPEPAGRAQEADAVVIEQRANLLAITINGREMWRGPVIAEAGRIGVVAEAGTILWVDRFLASSAGQPVWQRLLPTDAILGSGAFPGEWAYEEGDRFVSGFGFTSARPGARAKWNYRGGAFRLCGPHGPGYGTATLYVDGARIGEVSQAAANEEASRVLYDMPDLAHGYHAVSLVQATGTIACDSLEYLAP